MISRECFQREWILHQARAAGSRNPVMLEKAIVALQLLGHLAEASLPLQFKGGTSLLLRLSPPRRLSIDVDIVTQALPDQLIAALTMPSATGNCRPRSTFASITPRRWKRNATMCCSTCSLSRTKRRTASR